MRSDPNKLAVVMVGLPARGKTHLARRLARYLRWRGHETRVFNVGNYRRRHLGSHQRHHFFDPNNPEGVAGRERMAMAALSDLLQWFGEGGEVGIYDATNSTRQRRRLVSERLRRASVQVIFAESICQDETVIEHNIRETKLRMPDYVGVDPTVAVSDFRARIAHYARVYEPVDESEGSYVRIIDVGRKTETHRIQGYLPARLVYYLMNLHVRPRSIWLTRHGESEFNQQDRIGGDPPLSTRGRAFAQSLADYVRAQRLIQQDLRVWCSTLRRTRETLEPLEYPFEEWRALDEIDAGVCDSLTYADIAQRFPDDYQLRRRDKLGYRYPRGESYQDVIGRLEPVIVEIERERRPLLIVAHQAVLRALYAYLMDSPTTEIPFLEVPLHKLIRLTPVTYGCDEECVAL